MKTTAPYRSFGKGKPDNLNRRFADRTEQVERVSEGVVVHWATPRPDRLTENKSEEERKFFRDFGPRYTKRHPGPQARG